jgi:hypothetical protein
MTMEIKRMKTLIAIAAILLASCAETRLHTGWISVKKLYKMGYTHPVTDKKTIYIRRTADSAKANIVKR